jgi:hypothetical protein
LFGQLTICSKGHNFIGDFFILGKEFFSIWTEWVSKDEEFYGDFKNIALPWSKMQIEKVI